MGASALRATLSCLSLAIAAAIGVSLPSVAHSQVDAPDEEHASSTPVGEVIELLEGIALVSIGSEQGVEKGALIELYVSEREVLPDGEVLNVRRRLSVGRVVGVGKQRAEVALGFNERVSLGASATVFDPSIGGPYQRNLYFPPRAAGTTSFKAHIRPFLPLDTLGIGALLELGASFRLDSPLTIDLMVNPLGFALTSDESLLAFAASGALSLDLDQFQIGLGLGVARRVDGDSQGSFAPALVQLMRLGSIDGFHAQLHLTLLATREQWEFGSIYTQLQLPITIILNDTWFLFRAGGGVAGDVYADIGLRLLLSGRGREGSIFITPTIGIGSINAVNTTYAGPMLGVGLEWRN